MTHGGGGRREGEREGGRGRKPERRERGREGEGGSRRGEKEGGRGRKPERRERGRERGEERGGEGGRERGSQNSICVPKLNKLLTSVNNLFVYSYITTTSYYMYSTVWHILIQCTLHVQVLGGCVLTS